MGHVTEGAATIRAEEDLAISKKLDVFYNPVMRLNRDLTLLLLLARGQHDLRLADPLAGTGVRSIRMLKELPHDMIQSISVNDAKPGFKDTFTQNCQSSGCPQDKATVQEEDANRFLLAHKPFDYVDIDPFGSPNPFLDSAIKRTRRGGILAVTATDTAPLCGTYPKACERKYWAHPRRDHLMHEYGLRILIRKCQLVGAQYDKALIPVLSYSKHHYFRAFFEVRPGKSRVDDVLAQHQEQGGFGPLWTGTLYDQTLLAGMHKEAPEGDARQLLGTLLEEATIPGVGFYDVHVLSRALALERPPSTARIREALERRGVPSARTHFSPLGIKAACSEETIREAMQEAAR